MTAYYKATRVDGTSFSSGPSGRVDYAAALASGEIVRHPSTRRVRSEPATYLSVSVEPADCSGFRWPCRLFRVEPVGRIMANFKASPNKRAVSALRVVEELPAHLALGPNGEQVARFIDSCRTVTPEQAKRLAAALGAASDAAYSRARLAAADAAFDASRYASRYTAWRAAAWRAGDAAGYAAKALVVRDLIPSDQFATLVGPWVSVMGETWR